MFCKAFCALYLSPRKSSPACFRVELLFNIASQIQIYWKHPLKRVNEQPPSPSSCKKTTPFPTGELTAVLCFLCLQFQPASTKCQRTSSSTKAATWLSPVSPVADQNLPSPGGSSTLQVSVSDCLWWFSQSVTGGQTCQSKKHTPIFKDLISS